MLLSTDFFALQFCGKNATKKNLLQVFYSPSIVESVGLALFFVKREPELCIWVTNGKNSFYLNYSEKECLNIWGYWVSWISLMWSCLKKPFRSAFFIEDKFAYLPFETVIFRFREFCFVIVSVFSLCNRY